MATAVPPDRGGRGLWARLRGAAADGRHRALALRHLAERRFPVLTELTARLLSVNLLDAATRLAAQLFLTAVPFVFVAASFAPESVRTHLADSAHDLFGLDGASEDQLRQVYAAGGTDTETVRQTTGAIGVVVVLLSATASSRAMARVCERAWRLPRAGARLVAWRWFAWIAAWVAILVLQGPLRTGLGAGTWLGVPLLFVGDVGVWWWTQHLLLGGRLPWQPLLPGAVLSAVAMTALSVTAHLYMPTALNRSLATYGPLGSIFTLLSWLIAICAALTFTITAGAVLAEEPPLSRSLGTPAALRAYRRPGRTDGGAEGGTDSGTEPGEE
ncbi:YhjD/YihY/BrkB family envelope integrity protein [Actinacidiphila guanduensis]|uniref:Membrane protein n=1 Tax=Actinacidiphila guanduensis TaxID=310781 RepID=A0A1H0MTB9_9ACTN|nr:YhjD/YihY/BrkB family envelope integrity protein [Actinacidiphila guanduensis]SDO83647.1 membrane protein [Actinacidiphila guanduensis]